MLSYVLLFSGLTNYGSLKSIKALRLEQKYTHTLFLYSVNKIRYADDDDNADNNGGGAHSIIHWLGSVECM